MSNDCIKVFLDDLRETPPGWHRAYTAREAIEFCKTGKVHHISLDHDLYERPNTTYQGTGKDVTIWLHANKNTQYVPCICRIHSAYRPGAAEMATHLIDIERTRKPMTPANACLGKQDGWNSLTADMIIDLCSEDRLNELVIDLRLDQSALKLTDWFRENWEHMPYVIRFVDTKYSTTDYINTCVSGAVNSTAPEAQCSSQGYDYYSDNTPFVEGELDPFYTKVLSGLDAWDWPWHKKSKQHVRSYSSYMSPYYTRQEIVGNVAKAFRRRLNAALAGQVEY